MSKKELAKVEKVEIALPENFNDFKEVFLENLDDGETVDMSIFPRIKVPSGGAKIWSLPISDDEDDELAVKKFQAVIISKHKIRVYWDKDMQEGSGEPPVCISGDAKIGIGNPGGDCRTCPFAQFGSDGTGQACKLKERLYLLVVEKKDGKYVPLTQLPMIFDLPPTSLKNFKKYISSLTFKGNLYYGVITEFGLEGKKNANGIDYAEATFKFIEALPKDKAKQFRQNFLPLIDGLKELFMANALTDPSMVSDVPPENDVEDSPNL